MSESKIAYRHILKATSLLGSVQFITILLSVARSKIIAVLIGPMGMGISGLLNASLGILGSFTSFGLETSAIKHISQENKKGNDEVLARVIAVVKKTIWITGLIGALATIVFSRLLSELTFGTSDYTMAFVWLSFTLLFKQITNGHFAIIQGLQQLKLLAKCNLYSNVLGLVLAIPFYYCLGIDAIVPAIITSSVVGVVFSFYFERRLKIKKTKVTPREVITEGKEMIQLGLMLSLSGSLVTLVAYLLQIYISRSGLVQTGLYTAGITLLNSYVGIIFSTMSADYFPRLAAVNEDNGKVRTIVQQQALLAVLLLLPIIVVFIVFSPFIIQLLFTDKFMEIVPMVNFGIIGMFFKAASWSMGYILIAKGDSKLFIKTSIGFNFLFLTMMIFGYFLFGLTGVGIAFSLYYILHFAVVKVIVKKRYEFYFEKKFLKIFTWGALLCVSVLLSTFLENLYLKYSVFLTIIVTSVFLSGYELKREAGINLGFKNLKK